MATVRYAVGNSWGSGFIGNMTVDGGTAGVHGWTVEFDAGFAITNIWGAEIVSHVGTHYVLRNAPYNANVSSGGSVTFGFQAATGTTGGTAATGLSLNGAGGEPPPGGAASVVVSSRSHCPPTSIAAAPRGRRRGAETSRRAADGI